jgi:RNA polymerase-binding transcription factor DksA
MGRVLRPVFGKVCEECEEQIPPARIRSHPLARRCVECQRAVEIKNMRALQGAGDNDIVILRRT